LGKRGSLREEITLFKGFFLPQKIPFEQILLKMRNFCIPSLNRRVTEKKKIIKRLVNWNQ